jgi:hypothetical protein
LSTEEGNPAFFGGLGFVLHAGNTTRITCANFEAKEGGGNGTVGGNATGTSSSGVPEFTGAAGKVMAGVAAAVVGFAVVVLEL